MIDTEVIREECLTVRPSGEIDLSNVDGFVSTLNDAVAESPEGLVLDLSQVDYMDSAGVYAILNAYRSLYQSGGRLAIATGNENVRDILHVLHLEQLPGIVLTDNTESAVAAMTTGGKTLTPG